MPTPLLASKLKSKGMKELPKRARPVWEGPSSTGPNGGITQSLLSRFLNCRERFRLRVVEGLAPVETFSARMEYGNMWHLCEEGWALAPGTNKWQLLLHTYVLALARKFPMQKAEVEKHYNLAKLQFPIYQDYWTQLYRQNKHDKELMARLKAEHLMQEGTFAIPYTLPSGRVLVLRGKWDRVDLLSQNRNKEIWLRENKARGQIIEIQVKRQLRFDLQTMIYLVALREHLRNENINTPIKGIEYNIVRRPLAGGMHSIKPHKEKKTKNTYTPAETLPEFYNRLTGLIKEETQAALTEKRDCHYFMRWTVDVLPADIELFEKRFLIPIGEQLHDWWEYMLLCDGDPWKFREGNDRITAMNRHWQHPYGVWNSLDEGGSTDFDECVENGSEVGLAHTPDLFPELRS